MYLLLFCFWLLLNGKLTAEICLLGAAVTAALGVLEYALFGYSPNRELRIIRKAPLFLAFLFVLIWEIIKANFTVIRIILFRRYKLTPKLVTFRTTLRTDLGRFLLANSITLTPGTITIRVEGDTLTVHCLDGSMLDCSENGTFQRWIRRLEA